MGAETFQSATSSQESVRRRPWRSIVFAPEGDAGRRRRGSDGFRLGTAVMVVLIGLAITHLDPATEHKVLHFVSPPPNGVHWLVTSSYLLGSFGLSALMWLVFGMAALPYLSRTMQRLVELVIGLAALAAVVAGDGLPVNVAASVALG